MRVGDEELAGPSRTELTAEGAGALRGERGAGCGGQPSSIADHEAVNVPGAGVCSADLCPDEMGAVGAEEHVAGIGCIRERHRGAPERDELAARVEREAGVVGACSAVARVGDIDQVARDGDADRLDAVRREWASVHRTQSATVADAQHRDLVAAGVDGEQVASVAGHLECALRPNTLSGPRAARDEGRAVHGHQTPVGEPVEGADRVRSHGVVVHIDVSHHVGMPRSGRRGGCGQGCRERCRQSQHEQANGGGDARTQMHAAAVLSSSLGDA
jgi:hypothetical protein